MRTLPTISPIALIACDVIPDDTVLPCPAIPAELFRDRRSEPSREQANLMREYAKKCFRITGIKP